MILRLLKMLFSTDSKAPRYDYKQFEIDVPEGYRHYYDPELDKLYPCYKCGSPPKFIIGYKRRVVPELWMKCSKCAVNTQKVPFMPLDQESDVPNEHTDPHILAAKKDAAAWWNIKYEDKTG